MAQAQPRAWHIEVLARRHRSHLLLLARKLCQAGGIDAEDLVQETLERALQRAERLALEDEAGCRAWLCTTLTHRFLDLCRRRRTEMLGQPGLRLVQGEAVSVEEPRGEAWAAISEEELRSAVRKLGPRHREVYELHAAGMRYKEIAQRFGVPVGTVGSWLTEARRELRVLLHPELPEDGRARP